MPGFTINSLQHSCNTVASFSATQVAGAVLADRLWGLDKFDDVAATAVTDCGSLAC